MHGRQGLAQPIELAVEEACVAGEAVLHTRLVRIRGVAREVLDLDRKRVIEQPTRNCDTCRETSCHHHRNRRVG